jgi:8-oxo-dGTP diphosphatase
MAEMKNENAVENCDADVIEAAGGILWRETDRGLEMALIHRARYDDWTLPKGKLDEGERWQEAALREIKEETGCDAELVSYAGAAGYKVKGVAKVVLFWNMKAVGECVFEPSEEVDDLLWLSPDEALEKMSYEFEKELLGSCLVH